MCYNNAAPENKIVDGEFEALLAIVQMARRNVQKNSNFRKAYGWIRKKWMVTRPKKRTDLSGYTQADLDKVALRLNQCPRKTLGFETPASRLQASVAMTHRDRPGFRKLALRDPV